jgi:Zn-dependent M28 family amino/carboxypeptidase
LADALALAEQVDIDRLMADVIWLADDARRGRRVGSPEADAVAAWLTERFQTLGLPPFTDAGLTTHSLEFEAPGGAGQNVIAVLPGTQSSGNYVLIGAHYDHLGVTESGEIYNGADDDATGVAAVLEAARILSNASQRPQETIVFVAFSSEELGGQGSQALCQQLADHDLIDDSLLLNLEVLGAIQGTGTFLDVWDERDASTRPLVEAVQAAGQALGIPVQRQGRDPGSDAQVLLACGAPAVSLDVAWSYENHPYIHTPDDNVEHIDQSGLYKAAQVALAAIWLLANDGILD